MLSLILSLFVLGCGKENDDSAGESDADTDADADTDTDTDTDVDPNCIVVDGTVTTKTGGAGDQVRVQMCSSEICFVSDFDAGAYTFECLYADDYAFELAPLSTDPRYPSPSAPVTLVTGEPRTFDPVVLEEFTDVYDDGLEATTYLFEGGLNIDADPADMYFESGAVEPEGYLAGMVAPFEWGLPIDDEKLPDPGSTLVAMWYLGEFNVAITNPWPFTASNLYGLAAGTVLDILVMDYNRQAWAVGGTATVSKDGATIVSDDGSGIPILSTLLLVDPP
jgi:hypothetical protein